MSNGEDPRYMLGAMRPISEVARQAFEELKNPYPSFNLLSWPLFSRVTGGLRTREFSILCGMTGVGKTTFLANLSAQLMVQKVKHFVASVETGDTDFAKRVMSVFLEEDINRGEALPMEKIKDIQGRWDTLLIGDDLILSLFGHRISLRLLLNELKIASARHGCKVAMLDNLNFFMDVTAARDQIVEMDRTIHELIMFCKVTDMHVIMVMHPKKTESGRVESEFDIKGSSTAVQEAHNVFLFNRSSPSDEAKGYGKDFRELKIAKLRRRGEYTGSRIMFQNLGSCYAETALL